MPCCPAQKSALGVSCLCSRNLTLDFWPWRHRRPAVRALRPPHLVRASYCAPLLSAWNKCARVCAAEKSLSLRVAAHLVKHFSEWAVFMKSVEREREWERHPAHEQTVLLVQLYSLSLFLRRKRIGKRTLHLLCRINKLPSFLHLLIDYGIKHKQTYSLLTKCAHCQRDSYIMHINWRKRKKNIVNLTYEAFSCAPV